MPAGKAKLKEIVDEHLHRAGLDLEMLEIDVDDRLSERGERTLAGSQVRGASGGFLEMADGGRIPFHRVARVRSGTAIVYERPASSGRR